MKMLCKKCRGCKVIWTFEENAPKTSKVFNRQTDADTGRTRVQILCPECDGTGDGK